MKYNIIYADPPWQFKNYSDFTATKWVGQKYPLMTFEDICALPIRSIAADDSALLLWVTAPFLPNGIRLIEAWGFRYVTKAFTWIKTNTKSDTLFWGMGYWTRSNSEDCLLGTIGHPKRMSRAVHQVCVSKVREHSQKPDEIRERIVSLFGNLPRVELFARERTVGWDTWGNEIENTVIL